MKSLIRLKSKGKLIKINQMVFPGGEINVSIDDVDLDSEVTITAWLHDSDGLVALAQLKSILDCHQVKQTRFILGYVPYARQDRICNEGESLAIKVFADMINAMNFSEVVIIDPHSDVTPALLDRVSVISKSDLLKSISMANIDCFIAPDAGASKEVQKLAIEF